MRARFREMERARIRHFATSMISVVAKAEKIGRFTDFIGRNVEPCTIAVTLQLSADLTGKRG